MASTAHAENVGAFVGITYGFGSDAGIGFTIQATSTQRRDHAIVAAGISFYPNSNQKIGIPVGFGYQGTNVGALLSYDFLTQGASVSGGYASTRNRRVTVVPPTTPPTTPPSGGGGNGGS